jgi:predicted RNA-binding protein associated with RNAse of E/G family
VRGKVSYRLIRLPDRRSTFDADLLEFDEEHIVLAHRVFPSRPAIHFGEEVLGPGYLIVWFLFKGQPYDVGRFYHLDGTWTGYYVDVLEPVRWQGADPHTLVPIVDLFLDLWIAPDGRFSVLDEDELEDAVRAGTISPEQAQRARATLCRLVQDIERGVFPPQVVTHFSLD